MAKKQPTALSIRLKEAMRLRKVREAELVGLIQNLAAGEHNDKLRSKLSQQMVNFVLSGSAERSFYTPFFAEALKVPTLWLAFGIGAGPSAVAHPRSKTSNSLNAEVLAVVAEMRATIDGLTARLAAAGGESAQTPPEKRRAS